VDAGSFFPGLIGWSVRLINHPNWRRGI